jgi:probable rRNA maturation factor
MAELSITLVNDRTMAKLNRVTFGRRGPTNVIAFPVEGVRPGDSPLPMTYPEVPGPPLVLGEVVISVETTRRQAAELGWPWEELFDFYLIHGILHLLGYGHDTPESEAVMEAKTWEIMELLGEGKG